MKKYIVLALVALLSINCKGQEDDNQKLEANENVKNRVEQPKGSWKVDKEFDENGNLIRYDSIYSWSSSNTFTDFSPQARDSIMQSFKSRFFKNFSRFEHQGFDDVFSPDSLFTKQYFNDDFFGSDFGKDVMAIDRIKQQMIEKQKAFLEKYHSEFIKPEEEN